MSRVRMLGLAASVFLLQTNALLADTVFKKGGGKVVGTILDEQTDGTTVTIKSQFGTLRIPRIEIERIDFSDHPAPPSARAYEEVAKEYSDSAEDQFKLALWCLEKNKRKEYQTHLERVLQSDPDHEEARRRLGYRRIGEEWLTREQIRERAGYVKHQGKFVLPQEKEQAQLAQVDQKIRADFIRKIKLWQKWLRHDRPERRESARRELLDIRDPVAVGPLIDILGKKGEVTDRYLLVEILENIPQDASTQGLLLVALEDDFKKNRWRAIDALMARNSPPLVATVTARLKDKDNAKVRRAADILGEIGDDTVVPALVDALVTTHVLTREITLQERAIAAQGTVVNTPKTIMRPDGVIIRPSVTGISQAAVQANPGGLNVGQAPTHEMEVRQEKNIEVLGALTAITGEDFGYDKKRWIAWIREKHRQSSATITPTTTP